jgi:CO/xanthine dehydrogenase Mo-binding subunit
MNRATPSGRSIIRLDARAKVTGRAVFATDESFPGAATAKVVRSDVGHAKVTRIDVDRASGAPGVIAVLTSTDLTGLFPRFGHIVADHPILAIGKVRYYGEPIALVIGETAYAAADAAELVEVEYEELPLVMDAESALLSDAPRLHETGYEVGDDSFGEAIPMTTRPNVAHEAAMGWGDVEGALASARHVVKTEMRYPMLYPYAMEPYNAAARFDQGALDVITTAQHPFQVRDDLARIFGLPLASVRVRSPYIGGGYGSKSYTKVEPLAAVGAWVAKRPVKLVLNAEEAILTSRADSALVSVTSGFDDDGGMVARDIEIVLDSGAYADNSPLVLAKAVSRASGPYRVPNLRVRGVSVYTNTTPASSYRGFGAPQVALAGETNLDMASEVLAMSPKSVRQRNLLSRGEEVIPGKRPLDADLEADLEMLTESLQADRTRVAGRGVGFGCTASDAGAFPVSTATVKVLYDGSVLVLTGSTEMGQGSQTVLTQIAARELGVSIKSIRMIQGDTSLTSYERTTGASRTTTLTGTAVMRACESVRDKIEAMAAEAYDTACARVRFEAGGVAFESGERHSMGEVIERWFGTRAGEVTGVGVVRKADEQAQIPPFWEIGMSGVEVSVDGDTGVVVVEHLVTVGDVGFAINPRLVEGQDLGAATQGLGSALWEELVYDGAQPSNANIVEYRVPRTTDVPHRIDNLLAERQDGIGPYGAKGAGEGALNPIGAAVVSAVARATGNWPKEIPLTAERVWQLTQRKKDM